MFNRQVPAARENTASRMQTRMRFLPLTGMSHKSKKIMKNLTISLIAVAFVLIHCSQAGLKLL